MGPFGSTIFALVILAVALQDVNAGCPPPNWVKSGPACRDDYDCLAYKGPCCPNYLGRKSCVPYAKKSHIEFNRIGSGEEDVRASHFKTNKLYKTIGAGVYCNGVKCMPYQICREDGYTGKLQCQSPYTSGNALEDLN